MKSIKKHLETANGAYNVEFHTFQKQLVEQSVDDEF